MSGTSSDASTVKAAPNAVEFVTHPLPRAQVPRQAFEAQGLPLIVPGELITAERVDYLPSGLGAGMMVAYLPGPTFEGARPSRGVDDGGSERDVR